MSSGYTYALDNIQRWNKISDEERSEMALETEEIIDELNDIIWKYSKFMNKMLQLNCDVRSISEFSGMSWDDAEELLDFHKIY